ncbi:MAG: hypothetical protein MSC31_10190 [Solirubrobacteraceae bacterium MAG38_C4-C5]|nr:hypothetical protein [Candidatus Siliceabacter maunaloa]
MTEVLDRIEEELVAAARRRAAPAHSPRRRARASRRTLALAGAGVLLAGGGAVAAVTTNGSNEDENVTRLLQEDLLGVVAGGLRVELSVGQWTAVAYESDGGFGVRGSESLCLATVSKTMRQRPAGGTPGRDKPSALLKASCQGPWPLAEGPGLFTAPAPADGGRDPSSHLTSGLVPPDVRRAELLLPDGTRRPAELSRPFIVELAGNDLNPVPGAPRDAPPPGGTVSARLLAGATAAEPEAALLTFADGRTERVPLGR